MQLDLGAFTATVARCVPAWAARAEYRPLPRQETPAAGLMALAAALVEALQHLSAARPLLDACLSASAADRVAACVDKGAPPAAAARVLSLPGGGTRRVEASRTPYRVLDVYNGAPPLRVPFVRNHGAKPLCAAAAGLRARAEPEPHAVAAGGRAGPTLAARLEERAGHFVSRRTAGGAGTRGALAPPSEGHACAFASGFLADPLSGAEILRAARPQPSHSRHHQHHPRAPPRPKRWKRVQL